MSLYHDHDYYFLPMNLRTDDRTTHIPLYLLLHYTYASTDLKKKRELSKHGSFSVVVLKKQRMSFQFCKRSLSKRLTLSI